MIGRTGGVVAVGKDGMAVHRSMSVASFTSSEAYIPSEGLEDGIWNLEGDKK